MKVVWTELAKLQLKEIYHYYKEVASNKVASSIKKKIFEKIAHLSKFPMLGQLENNPVVASRQYRYLVSGNYKIVYRVDKDSRIVLILAVFDTRQNPDNLVV
jgi:plasmid stabilization system protein ParE